MFIVLMFVILVFGLLYGYALLTHSWPFIGLTMEQTGVFGDSWGAFTSIFSALGFCGVLWTIQLQRVATRKIEEDARKREQSEKIRDFENSFFNILNILQTIIDDMHVTNKKRDILSEGRGIFLYYFSKFFAELRSQSVVNKEFSVNSYSQICVAKQEMAMLYYEFFSSRTQYLSHYFRYLYNAFKFIDEASLDEDVKRKYANILRAQLSNYELLILFYNSLSEHGHKFRKYFIAYAVLDNLPVDKLIEKKHVLFVDKRSWGDNKLALQQYF